MSANFIFFGRDDVTGVLYMPVIAMFYVVPIVGSPSVSDYVAKAVEVVAKRGHKYVVTPAATVFEADSVKEALETIAEAVEAVKKAGALRVIAEIKIDERIDKPLRMDEMPRKVLEKLDVPRRK